MSDDRPTEQSFLEDMKNHSMTVLQDNGLYRHLSFSNNGSFNQKFDIITWPEHLAMTGDMGDWLFTRTKDMLCFFRDQHGKLRVNPGYWSEKVVAESKHGGLQEFSMEVFRKNVLEDARLYLDLEDDQELSEEQRDEIQHLLDAEDEYEAVAEIRDHDSKIIPLSDFWESSCKRFTYHFLWACYAIAWAVIQYDTFKEKE